MSDSPAAPHPRRLGRYEIIAEIARGGMGTVYLARHAGEAGFQRLFAVKLMHPHLAEDREFVDMLLDEARLAARIHHPNVVAIVDLGSDAGRHYVVLDYVDGCALSALLSRHREQRPPELIVPIVVDALEGLHAAHSLTDDDGKLLRLVHRDVSPQNILVGADGVGRITDFGIAKAETRITSTRPGTRKGKTRYMAPEQLSDDEHLDRRADVFAAGAVLWSALTGRSLFRGPNDAATVRNILCKEVPPPSSMGMHPPEAFDAVCLKALERDPEKRFDSALDMADALRRAAVEAGLSLSRSAVADWVAHSFGDELEQRRQAIRSTSQRSQSQRDSMLELPPLGPVSRSWLPSSGGAESAVSPDPGAVPSYRPGASTTPPPHSTTASHELDTAVMLGSAAKRRRRALAVGAAVLVPIAIGVVWAASHNGGHSAQPTASASALVSPSAEAPPPNTPPPANTIPTLAPSELPLAPAPSATQAAHRHRAPARPRAARRHAKSKASAHAAAAPAHSAPKPQATAPAAPANAGVQIENNPYLRRK